MSSGNCCDTSYYRTPYNIQMQKLYCDKAQAADTNVKTMVTSGWSYNRLTPKAQLRENYCNCDTRLVNTPMVLKYKQDSMFC